MYSHITREEYKVHPNISLELAERGILPDPNKENWTSQEIPYTSEQIDEAWPGRPFTCCAGTWFLKKTGRPFAFSFDQAKQIDHVPMEEVMAFLAEHQAESG